TDPPEADLEMIVTEKTDSYSFTITEKDGAAVEKNRAVSETAERKERKNALKQLVYKTLSEYTGKELPWGDLTGIRPALTVSFGQGFDDFYLLTRPTELSSLSLQREEVAEVRWAEEGEILRMIDGGTFIPYEKSLISLLFFLRGSRDVHTKKDPTGMETRAAGEPGKDAEK
ncbi:MAG: hypothetical protein IKX85_04545, partial [Clostridia bacterium]|nr:hypothetical protein [Clostridia bacterium]